MADLPDAPWSGPRTFVIAEIGINHNGSLELAKQTIDAAVAAGVDAVKFQSFRTEEFLSDRELEYTYENAGARVTERMFDMFKRLELPEAWHAELFRYAADKGCLGFTSVADPVSLQIALQAGSAVLKIASEDCINLPLLEVVARTKPPVILSTGMADADEIARAVAILGSAREILVMHCVSLYPTPADLLNLRRIATLGTQLALPVGLSDHTDSLGAGALAVAFGARAVEKHFTLDRALPGPDHAFSLDPAGMAEYVARIREAERMVGDGALAPSPDERAAALKFRRSLTLVRDLPAGHALAIDDVALKRPATGIPPHQRTEIVGRRLARAMRAGDKLRWEDLLP